MSKPVYCPSCGASVPAVYVPGSDAPVPRCPDCDGKRQRLPSAEECIEELVARIKRLEERVRTTLFLDGVRYHHGDRPR